MENTIFISIDRNYYALCAMFLQNIKNKYPDHPLIHIVYIDLTKKQRTCLYEINHNTKFIENDINEDIIGPIMIHLDKTKYNPKVFYARFMIFNEYFSQFNKILHLDVDVYIHKNIGELFKKTDFFIVKDVYGGTDFIDTHNIALKRQFLKDGITQIPTCCNAGIFLITKKYLNSKVLDSLIQIKDNYSEYIKFADQSIINIWLHLNKIDISNEYQYNLQYRLYFQDYNNMNILMSPSIVHLAGLEPRYKYLLMKLFNFGFYKTFVLLNKISKGFLSKHIF